jgi:tripartite-type tricarboxylate transporter receptor subunit TctC
MYASPSKAGGFGMARLAAVLWVLALGATAVAAGPLPLPDRPITLVVGAAAGGGIDVIARLVAPRLSTALGRAVVVENRPGAGTRMARDFVARAQPDGATLLVTTAGAMIDDALRAGGGDIPRVEPVSTIAATSMLMVVRRSLPVVDVGGLVALARRRPGALNFSSSGVGTIGHLAGEAFKAQAGVDIVHVPYKGAAPSAAALVAGEVDMTFASVPAVRAFVDAGRLRALAVLGARRSPLVPGLPTLAEAGVAGVEAELWYGVFAPPGTPREVIETLAHAIIAIARDPAFARDLAMLGAETFVTTPAELAQRVRNDTSHWSAVARAAGATAH